MLRKILTGVLITFFCINLLVTKRDWALSDQGRAVAHAAWLPREQASDRTMATSWESLDMVGRISALGIHVPHKSTKAADFLNALTGLPVHSRSLVNAEGMTGVGKSIREWSFFGMPFAWYTEYGWVLYYDNPVEIGMAPLNEQGVEQVNHVLGRDVQKGFVFPFWAHGWGWLFVAVCAFTGWLYYRASVRRREEQGWI